MNRRTIVRIFAPAMLGALIVSIPAVAPHSGGLFYAAVCCDSPHVSIQRAFSRGGMRLMPLKSKA